MQESRGRLGVGFFFCMASVFAPLYACAYASGMPAFVRTSVLGSCAVQLAPRMCVHAWLWASTDIFANFACCVRSEASFDGREVPVPFDRYAVLTVIRPTLCLFGHFSITKRGSPQTQSCLFLRKDCMVAVGEKKKGKKLIGFIFVLTFCPSFASLSWLA